MSIKKEKRVVTRESMHKSNSLGEALENMKEHFPWCVTMSLKNEEGEDEQDGYWQVFQLAHGFHAKRYGKQNIYMRDNRFSSGVCSVNRLYFTKKVAQKIFCGWKYELAPVSAESFDWVSNKHIDKRWRGMDPPVVVPKSPRKSRYRTIITTSPKKTTRSVKDIYDKLFLDTPKDRDKALVDTLMPKQTPIERIAKKKVLKEAMKKRQEKNEW